ncbi:MAG: choice-of-anchor J domain-containing protein [Planctomycetota bacterium]|jgi:hypothetical protein
MRPSLLAVSLLAANIFVETVTAQGVALSEDFSSGVPPIGWTMTNNNGSSSQGWIASPNSRAWHEDEALSHGGLTSDDSLITPALDLSTFTSVHLHFSNELGYANYLANHPNSLGDGENNVEVSVDGGVTWALVWTEMRTSNGLETTHLDLSAYAGIPNVQVAFRYYGTWAQEWWVDDVLIDDRSGLPLYTITNLVAGQMADFRIENLNPSTTVVIAYSLNGAGPTITPYGLVDMSAPIRTLATLVADASGVATFSPTVPGGAVGFTLYTQCLEFSSGSLSNSLAVPVL